MPFEKRLLAYLIAFIAGTWYVYSDIVAGIRHDALTDPSAVAILSFPIILLIVSVIQVTSYLAPFAIIVEICIWLGRDKNTTPPKE